jgi:hypothetical protein
MLQIALQLDPNYADAMAYMNLLDRLKSGLVDSAVESRDLLSKADDWVGKALNAKRRTTQSQPPPTAIDVDGPPPGPASTRMAFAAPPPPPPPPPPAWVSGNQAASSSPPLHPRNAAELPGVLWQVTGRADLPANALARVLRDKGFTVRAFADLDNQVRVLVGPYTSTQSLEQAKVALEAAGFRPIRTW